jgi:hypothetical protein
MQEVVEPDYEVFVSGEVTAFGAVREVSPQGRPELVVYVENAGDFIIPFTAVEAVHGQKIIVNRAKLGPHLGEAIDHAHDTETYPPSY